MLLRSIPCELIVALALAGACVPASHAQSQSSPESQDSSSPAPYPVNSHTMFSHSDSGRFWISGQANVILQLHPSFPSEYSGPNSLSAAAQSATSHSMQHVNNPGIQPRSRTRSCTRHPAPRGFLRSGGPNGCRGLVNPSRFSEFGGEAAL